MTSFRTFMTSPIVSAAVVFYHLLSSLIHHCLSILGSNVIRGNPGKLGKMGKVWKIGKTRKNSYHVIRRYFRHH